MKRYLSITMTEFVLASAGYWRNWERNTAWLMRELVFTLISGNPDIKRSDKPSKKAIMKLSIDKPSAQKVDVSALTEKAKQFENKLKYG